MIRLLLALGLVVPGLANAEIRVIDDSGQRLVLHQAARRIISLAPNITEMVFAAGAERYLVAVDSYSDYPPAVASQDRIGAVGALDREKLLQLQPDLVLAWRTGNRNSDLEWLRRQRIPLYQVEPDTLESIANTLINIGQLANTRGTANAAAANYRKQLRAACNRPDKSTMLPVYYEIWSHPAMTLGGQHWLNEALGLAGLRNIFSDQPRAVMTVSYEAIMGRPHALRIVSADSPPAKHFLNSVPVIRRSRLLDRPGPRIVDGIADLCSRTRNLFPGL